MAAERQPGGAAFEDAQLIDRINAGQTEAYADLVRKYQDRVFNTCWRICGHLEDARDVTQEAFLKAFEGLDRFRGQSGFYTWVFRIAVNLALSHRRAAARSRTVSWDQRTDASRTQAAELARRVATDPNDDPARAQSRAVRRKEGKRNGTVGTHENPTGWRFAGHHPLFRPTDVSADPPQYNDEQRSDGRRDDEPRNAKYSAKASAPHIGFPHSGQTPDSLPVRS